MDPAEQTRTLAAIRSSWETLQKAPQRFVRSVQAREFGLMDSISQRTLAHNGESSLAYSWWDSRGQMIDGGIGHFLEIDDGEFLYNLHDAPKGWRISARHGKATLGYREERYEAKDELIDWSVELPSRTDPAELEYVEEVERIDDVRVRLFFRPFFRAEERPGYGRRRIQSASVILREDLDWTPESIRDQEEDSFSIDAEERRYARVGGYVVPIEILSGPISREATGWVVGINERTQFAWRIDPTFEPETFSVNRFLAEPLPSPRDLPAWRWHRVTFAISVALFAFLIGRSAIGLLRRNRRSEDSTDESSPAAIDVPGSEPAVASTPGS